MPTWTMRKGRCRGVLGSCWGLWAKSGVARHSGEDTEGVTRQMVNWRRKGEAQLKLERSEAPLEVQVVKVHSCSWPAGMKRNCLFQRSVDKQGWEEAGTMEISKATWEYTALPLLMSCTSKHLFNQMRGVGGCWKQLPILLWYACFILVFVVFSSLDYATLIMCSDLGFVHVFWTFILDFMLELDCGLWILYLPLPLDLVALYLNRAALDFLGLCKWV